MLRDYQITENDEFRGFLNEILERQILEGAATGITKHVVSHGIKGLSAKQLEVFKQQVLDKYTIAGCIACGSEIPWSEMFKSATGTKLCRFHESNLDRET